MAKSPAATSNSCKGGGIPLPPTWPPFTRDTWDERAVSLLESLSRIGHPDYSIHPVQPVGVLVDDDNDNNPGFTVEVKPCLSRNNNQTFSQLHNQGGFDVQSRPPKILRTFAQKRKFITKAMERMRHTVGGGRTGRRGRAEAVAFLRRVLEIMDEKQEEEEGPFDIEGGMLMIGGAPLLIRDSKGRFISKKDIPKGDDSSSDDEMSSSDELEVEGDDGKNDESSSSSGDSATESAALDTSKASLMLPAPEQDVPKKTINPNEQDFFDQHNDLCEVCNLPGELLCCATCNLVFHVKCARPKLVKMPPDDWKCAYCIAAGVMGGKREGRERRRAAQAVREMERSRRKLKEAAAKDAAEREATAKTKNVKPNPFQGAALQNHVQTKHCTEQSPPEVSKIKDDLSIPKWLRTDEHDVIYSNNGRIQRSRKKPIIFNPQSGPDSEWKSDGGAAKAKTKEKDKAKEHDKEKEKPYGKNKNNEQQQDPTHSVKRKKKEKKKVRKATDKRKKTWKKKKNSKKESNPDVAGIGVLNRKPASLFDCSVCLDIHKIKICCYCACRVCFNKFGKDRTLLCDKCDSEYHTFCLNPPLLMLPGVEEKWFCPVCVEDDTNEEATEFRKKAVDTSKKDEEDKRRPTQEKKKKIEEEKRIAAEIKKRHDEEKKRAAIEEKKRIAAEEKKRAAAEIKKVQDEEKKRAVIEEKRRIAAEEKKRAAAEIKKIQDEEKKRAAVEEKRIAAEEKQRVAAEEKKRIAAEEKKRIAAEEKKRIAAEEKKRIAAEEKKRIAAEEKKRIAAEEKMRVAAEEKKKTAAEEKMRVAAEEKKRIAAVEKKRIVVEEKKRVAAEETKKAALEEKNESTIEEKKSIATDEKKESTIEEKKSIATDEKKPGASELGATKAVKESTKNVDHNPASYLLSSSSGENRSSQESKPTVTVKISLESAPLSPGVATRRSAARPLSKLEDIHPLKGASSMPFSTPGFAPSPQTSDLDPSAPVVAVLPLKRGRGRPRKDGSAPIPRKLLQAIKQEKTFEASTAVVASGAATSKGTDNYLRSPTVASTEADISADSAAELLSVEQRSRSGRKVQRFPFHDEIDEACQHARETKKAKIESIGAAGNIDGPIINNSPPHNAENLLNSETPRKTSFSDPILPLKKEYQSPHRVVVTQDPKQVAKSYASFRPNTPPQPLPNLSPISPTTSAIVVTSTNIAPKGTVSTAETPKSSVQSPPPVKVPRRKPGARECMQISRRFGANVIDQKYMNTLLDYCTRGKVEHLIRMRERLDEHSRFLESQLAGLETLVRERGELDVVVPPADSESGGTKDDGTS